MHFWVLYTVHMWLLLRLYYKQIMVVTAKTEGSMSCYNTFILDYRYYKYGSHMTQKLRQVR